MDDAKLLALLTDAERAELDALLDTGSPDEGWADKFGSWGKERHLDADPEWCAALADYRNAVAEARAVRIPPADWHAGDSEWIVGGKVVPQVREPGGDGTPESGDLSR